MAKSDEQEFSAVFPVSGLDVTCEYGRQPGDTTPDAANVSSYDTLADRSRGGSREGIAKFNPSQVVDATEVQHLALLVDPQSPFLRTDADATGAIPDTSTSDVYRPAGRYVRPGGSGRPSGVPTVPPVVPTPGDIELVQSQPFSEDATTSDVSFTLDDQPESVDSVIIVVVLTLTNAIDNDITVTNANLNAYTQVGDYEEELLVPTSDSYVRMSFWIKTASAGVPDTEIRISAGGTETSYAVVVLEYRNMATTGAADGFSANSDPSAVSMTTGAISVGGANELVIAAFGSAFSTDTIATSTPDFDKVEELDGSQVNAMQLTVFHRLGVDFPETPDVTAEFAGGAQSWTAIGASFEPE